MEKSVLDTDQELRIFIDLIADGNIAKVLAALGKNPSLASAQFTTEGNRENASGYFISSIGQYIYKGRTALHFAAAAYHAEIVDALRQAGADVHARDRLGDEPLHLAATSDPNSSRWNPEAQATTISILLKLGADPNSRNKNGATPLHIAIRTRCASAVQALMEGGADASITTKSGTTCLELAGFTTGRGGSGTPVAKEEQAKIIHLLDK